MENSIVEISATALRHNIVHLSKKIPKKTVLMCVIKANAYGHGLTEVAEILVKDPHVQWFGVFDFNDALVLRKKTKKPILVLCNVAAVFWPVAVKKNISVTISTQEELLELTSFNLNKKLTWHLKVDTGLGRQGFLMNQMNKIIALIDRYGLSPEGLYSHLSGAEEKQFDQYSFDQYTRLLEWKKALTSISRHPLVHLSGTAGVLRYDLFGIDMVRLGIGMYGLWPSEETKTEASKTGLVFKPVLSWKTQVNELKSLPKGASIAYDLTYSLTRDSIVAVLPVGYWDGLPRALSSRGVVLVRGRRAPIIGRVMMNMCIVDVTDIPGVKKNDRVTLIGTDKGQTLSAEEFAFLAGTIHYEVVTRINPLIRRTVTGLQKNSK